jgi:hypothetical protein
MRHCPNCQVLVKDGDKFCDKCGTRLTSSDDHHSPFFNEQVKSSSKPDQLWATGVCASCGKKYILGEMFCEHCGVQIPPSISISKPIHFEREHIKSASPLDKEPEYVGGQNICTYCGKRNDPESKFCQLCGTILYSGQSKEEIRKSQLEDDIFFKPKETIRLDEQSFPSSEKFAKLILYGTDNEIILESNTSRFLIGRTDTTRDVFPDIDLVPYGGKKLGVSRRHAEIIFQEEEWFLQDLNSTNYTFLNNQKLLPGKAYQLSSGDLIRFGMMVLTFQRT